MNNNNKRINRRNKEISHAAESLLNADNDDAVKLAAMGKKHHQFEG
jgi:hypothetical protein